MQKLVKKLHRPIKRRWLFVAIAIVLVMLIGAWAYNQHRARPLDNNFEYLGKSDYGCWSRICDSDLGSIYYYGTNLSSTEMSHYFKDATYSKELSNRTYVNFISPEQGFSITYENKKDLPYNTDKKYVVTLTDSAYNVAKKHLP